MKKYSYLFFTIFLVFFITLNSLQVPKYYSLSNKTFLSDNELQEEIIEDQNSLTQEETSDMVDEEQNEKSENKTDNLENPIDIEVSDSEDYSESNTTSSMNDNNTSISTTTENNQDVASVMYRTYVEGIGWQDYKKDGETSSANGSAKGVQGLAMKVTSQNYTGCIQYQSYIEGIGWHDYRYDGGPSGLIGQSKRIEAIKIKLFLQMAEHYDVYYRVNVDNIGWLGWAKNGEIAGTINYGYKINGIEVKLVEKNAEGPQSEISSYKEKEDVASVMYRTYGDAIGWQAYKKDGETSSATGNAKGVQGLAMKVSSQNYTGCIQYQSYIEGIGWHDFRYDGGTSGLIGQSKRIEAIKIKLFLQMAEHYDVYYRVNVDNIGWLGWAKNGEIAGTINYGYKINGIEVKLVDKNAEGPQSEISSYKEKEDVASVMYRTYGDATGWQAYKKDGETSSASGSAKGVQGLAMKVSSQKYTGSIQYQSYIEGIGWHEFRYDGGTSGLIGQAKRIEAIKIKLFLQMAEHYDVYYRVNVQNLGWLGWAKNGEIAGTINYGYKINGIEVKLVEKNAEGPQSEISSYKEKEDVASVMYRTYGDAIGWQAYKKDGETSSASGNAKGVQGLAMKVTSQKYTGSIQYQAYIEGIGWHEFRYDGGASGLIGQAKRIEAIKVKLFLEMADHYDIYYRVNVENFGWLGWAKNGEIAGTINYGYKINGIEVVLVEKDTPGPESNTNSLKRRDLIYQSYIQDLGWQEAKQDGEMSGTNNKGKRIEAIKVRLIYPPYSGGIEYKSYISGFGWEKSFKSNNQVSGTIGTGKQIEAIQFRLTGELADYYDIYYRAYSQGFGWLGWTKNGESAGTVGYSYRLEAYEIMLVKKDEEITLDNKTAFLSSYENYYTIESKLAEKTAVSVYNQSTVNGTNVLLNNNYSWVSQIWQLIDLKNGYYKIVSAMNPNISLSVNNNSNNVFINKYSGSDGQLWYLSEAGGGYYYIISKLNNMCLEVAQSNTINNSNIQVSAKNGSEKQMFLLIPYTGMKMYNGLDVSSHNGEVGWYNIANSDTNFAILRLGFGGDFEDQDDSTFLYNVKWCEEFNIPYGVYIYSYALDTASALDEVQHALRLIKTLGDNFLLGVWFDMEDADGYKARHGMPSAETLVDISATFINEIEKNGYKSGLYASLNWLNGVLNSPKLSSVSKWVAQWSGPVTYRDARNTTSAYPYTHKFWQFCSDGHISGTSGNTDLSIGYNIFN